MTIRSADHESGFTTHAEHAPLVPPAELVRFEAKPWIGIVLNSVDDLLANQARLLVLCSSDCKNTFFRNGG